MAKGDPDEELFDGVTAAEEVCEFRGWIKDTQIATDGSTTVKFGVYLPDKWKALLVTDVRERVVSVTVNYLKPAAKSDRTHLDLLRQSRAEPTLGMVIDAGDVIDLTTARILPDVFIMSNGDGGGYE